MNICKNNCSVDSINLIDMMETVKSIYERIAKDVCQYAKELEKFQIYYQKYNLNDDVMLNVMYLKLDRLLNLFYTSVYNHLSVTTNVRGIGDLIIKPVRQEYGTSTTLKYQNICDSSNPNKPTNTFNNTFNTVSAKQKIKVQTTVSVATYDNMSIDKIINCNNNSFGGYELVVGKLSYKIKNYQSIPNIKNMVDVLDTCIDDNLYGYTQVEAVTSKSIELLYDFVDEQIETLSDIEMLLMTNIDYINKYIKRFLSNIK